MEELLCEDLVGCLGGVVRSSSQSDVQSFWMSSRAGMMRMLTWVAKLTRFVDFDGTLSTSPERVRSPSYGLDGLASR